MTFEECFDCKCFRHMRKALCNGTFGFVACCENKIIHELDYGLSPCPKKERCNNEM